MPFQGECSLCPSQTKSLFLYFIILLLFKIMAYFSLLLTWNFLYNLKYFLGYFRSSWQTNSMASYPFLSHSIAFYCIYCMESTSVFLKGGGGFDFLILEQLLFKPMEKLSMEFFLLGDIRLIPPFLISLTSFLGYHSSLDGVYPLVTSLEMVCGRWNFRILTYLTIFILHSYLIVWLGKMADLAYVIFSSETILKW